MTTTEVQTIDLPALNADDTALAHWLAEKIIAAHEAEGPRAEYQMSTDDWDGVAAIGFQCVPVVTACSHNGYRFLRDYIPANWAGVKIFADLLAMTFGEDD